VRTVAISQPMYFPWVGILEQIRLADVFVHLDDAQFSKGSFFNRVQVKTAQGTPWLSVPLAQGPLGEPLNETRIAVGRWKRKHIQTLTQAYAAAPFRKEMLALAESVMAQDFPSIANLSAASTESVADYFGMRPSQVLRSSELDIPGTGSDRVLAICSALNADRYITGHGARNYLDHELFEESGIRVEYLDYLKLSYPQLHGEFVPFVSSLDLIANCGRDGESVLCSPSIYWRDFLQ